MSEVRDWISELWLLISWPAYFFNSHIFTIPGRRVLILQQTRDLCAFVLDGHSYLLHCFEGLSLLKSSTPRSYVHLQNEHASQFAQEICFPPVRIHRDFRCLPTEPRFFSVFRGSYTPSHRIRSKTMWKLPWWLSSSLDTQGWDDCEKYLNIYPPIPPLIYLSTHVSMISVIRSYVSM